MGTLTTICMGHKEGGEVHPCGTVLRVQEGVVAEDSISHGVCADCYVIITGVPPHWLGQEQEYSEVCQAILKDGADPF